MKNNKMGSKIAQSSKTKRKGISCGECPLRFTTVTALKAHRLKHKNKRGNPIKGGNKSDKLQEKTKTIKGPLTATKMKSTGKSLPKRTDVKCHICLETFSSRIVMLNHYKTTHFKSSDVVEMKVDAAMNKLMNTVKKATQDQSKCPRCSKIFATRKSMLLHICKTEDETKEQYRCSGCKKKFETIDNVDWHVVAEHDDNVDILVFKNVDEFEIWKKKEENRTKMRYIIMSETDKTNKVYRCAARVKCDAKENVKELCPAAMMLRNNKDTIKISFYKKHYGHPHVELVSDDEKEDFKVPLENDTSLSGSVELSETVKIEDNKDPVVTNSENTENDTEEEQTGKEKIECPTESSRELLKCLSCKQTFNSLKPLHLHLSAVHNDDIHSILFPDLSGFLTWKMKMEAATNTKFGPGVKYDQKTYYSCEANIKKEPKIDDKGYEWLVKHVCPSTIVTKLYEKGVQVHFYQIHYDHKHTEYTPTDEIQKYDIRSMFDHVTGQKTNIHYKRRNVNTLEYQKLKKLLWGVLSISEILPVDYLKFLIKEANSMSVMAKSLLEDFSPSRPPQKEMTAAKEITTPKEKITKRKQEVDTDSDKEVRASKRIRERKSKDIRTPIAPIPIKNAPKIKSNERMKSPIVSADIPITGIPKIVNTYSLSEGKKDDKKTKEDSSTEETQNHSSEINKAEANGIDKPENNILKKALESSKTKYESLLTTSSFSDSYKSFIEENWVPQKKNEKLKNVEPEKVKPKSKKKNDRVKTKLGQYSPKYMSPKTKSPKQHNANKSPKENITVRKTPITAILGKVKVDKYEVKEQENDCNILILKI